MTKRNWLWLAAVFGAVLTLSNTVSAQNGMAGCNRVIQNGAVQNGQPVVWSAPCLIAQAGGSAGSSIVNGLPMLTDLGVMGPFGILDGPITGAYHQALLGWSGNNFNINLNSRGGAGTPAGFLVINGGTPIPLGGGGSSVTWPASGAVVVSNGSNSPAGVAPVNGDVLYGVGGAWTAASLSSLSNGVITWPTTGDLMLAGGNTPSAYGGGSCPSGQFVSQLSASGALNCATPAGGGNVTGPGSSTNGFVPQWNGTSGTLLTTGLPVGTTGNSTIVETGSGGLLSTAILPLGSSGTPGAIQCGSGTSCSGGVLTVTGGGGSGTVGSGTTGQIAGYPASATTVGGVTVSGDFTLSGVSGVGTLATVNSSPGSTTCSNITTNGKGLVTGNSNGSCGSGVTWPSTGDIVVSNGTNTPPGIAPFNGDIVYGSGGAWVATSLSSFGFLTSNGISGLTTGQLGVAGSATTLTSSVPFGTTGNSTVLETDSGGNEKAPVSTTTGAFSSTVTLSGLNAGSPAANQWIGLNGSNQLVTGTPAGGISGLTTGQIPVAGSATSLTSSLPFGTTGISTLLQTDPSGNEKAPVNTTTGTYSGQIISTVSTGTAPLVIASTTNVPNLNASSLSGATFAAPGSIGSGTPGSGAFTSLSANSTVTTTGLSAGSPASNKWIGLNGSNQFVTGTPGGTVGSGTAGQIPGYASSSSTLTPVTVSGDFTLNGATGVGTLNPSGVAAGSYTFTNATIDTKGRITTASSGSFTLSPGLGSSSTYNTGSQVATSGSVVSSQLFYEGHGTSYAVLTTDGGKLITSTAASLTFTLPNPGAVGSSTFQFGYDGTHSYTLTTVGGTANIYGCVGSGTSVSLSKAVQVVTDGTNYQCI